MTDRAVAASHTLMNTQVDAQTGRAETTPKLSHADLPATGQKGLIVHNTALNLVGQWVPLLVGLFATPYIVSELGPGRFGLLSVGWVVLGYFSVLDLGFGRATTKFVAECLEQGQTERVPALLWTSLSVLVLLGSVAAVLAAVLTPVAVTKLLKIPPPLIGEARTAFLILAASFPAVVATNAVRGVLEAAQRFDLVNYVKVPANISVFVLPVIALLFGSHLPGIFLLLVLSRLIAMLAYLACCYRTFPALRHSFSVDLKLFGQLLGYGGWLTLSSVLGTLLMSMDRLLIGSRLPVAVVGYYAAPYEAVARVWTIPGSLSSTLFPTFSSMGLASESKTHLEQLYCRSLKSLLLTLGPLMSLVIVFAPQLLGIWLGPVFAAKSSTVMQVLALGVLVNSLAFVPFTLIHALGRPDVTAKFHMIEFPLFAGLLWVLIGHDGIQGAAIAWTIRLTLDAALLFGGCAWLGFVPLRAFARNGLPRTCLAVLLFAVACPAALLISKTLWARTVFVGILTALFAVGGWSFILDSIDKAALASAAAKWLRVVRER